MGLPFEVAGRMASLLGAWQVEFNGTQNLDLNVELFKERYEREFGRAF
jgi:adenosine kinase